jgi:hypothetical protein
MKIKTKKSKKFKVEKYERGTHKFIEYYNMLLKLLQMEKETLSKLLDFTSMEDSDLELIFPKIFLEPLATFAKQAEDVWKRKQKSKVLVLLDILEHCESLVSEFRETLQKGYDKVIEMIEQLRKATRKALEEKVESIQDHPPKDIPRDGGYSSLTVEVRKFIDICC